MAGGKLISTGVEFPDATTQTTSGLPLTGGTMTGTIAGFTSTGIDDNATSTAITIDASENVLVKATSPGGVGVTLYSSGANAIHAKCTDTVNYWITNSGQGAGAGTIATIYSDTTVVGSIGCTASSTSYNTSSDYRLKENVVPMAGSIDRLKALKPSRFNFISEPLNVVDGFLAHEAGEVVPECATGTKDAMMDEEYEVTPAVMDGETIVTEAVMGTRSVPDYQGIDQSKLSPLTISALQEAITLIEQLTARVTELENA